MKKDASEKMSKNPVLKKASTAPGDIAKKSYPKECSEKSAYFQGGGAPMVEECPPAKFDVVEGTVESLVYLAKTEGWDKSDVMVAISDAWTKVDGGRSTEKSASKKSYFQGGG